MDWKEKKEQIKWIWIFSENKKDKANECGIGNNYNPNVINWNYCYTIFSLPNIFKMAKLFVCILYISIYFSNEYEELNVYINKFYYSN
jgi:hypothetical protein